MIDNEKIFLFDMDGTLTPPRKQIETKVVRALRELSKFVKMTFQIYKNDPPNL